MSTQKLELVSHEVMGALTDAHLHELRGFLLKCMTSKINKKPKLAAFYRITRHRLTELRDRSETNPKDIEKVITALRLTLEVLEQHVSNK